MKITALTADSSAVYVGEWARPFRSPQSSLDYGIIRRIDAASRQSTIIAGGGPDTRLRTDVPATETKLGRVEGLGFAANGDLLLTTAGRAYRLPLTPGAHLQPVDRERPGFTLMDTPGDVTGLSDGRVVVAAVKTRIYRPDGTASTALNQAPVDGEGSSLRFPNSEGLLGINKPDWPYSVAPDGANGFYYTAGGWLEHEDGNGFVTTTVAPKSTNLPYDNPDVPDAIRLDSGSVGIVRREAGGTLLLMADGVVYRRQTDGTLTRLAGGGSADETQPGPATGALLRDTTLAPDGVGGFYLSRTSEDGFEFRDSETIQHVDTAGLITPFAGNGLTYGGDGGPATDATFGTTYGAAHGLAVGPDGTVYISDTDRRVVRAVSPGGLIRTVAGRDAYIFEQADGDGGPASAARLWEPTELSVDGVGDLFIVDQYRIRKVNPAGIITTVLDDGGTDYDGTPTGAPAPVVVPGFNGARIAATVGGTLYIAPAPRPGEDNRLLALSPDGHLREVASSGPIRFLATSGETLYSSYEGVVYRLGDDGTFETYADVKGSDSRITSGTITAAPDGSLFVNRAFAPTVRIDPDTTQHNVVGADCDLCAHGANRNDPVGSTALSSSEDVIAAYGDDLLVAYPGAVYRMIGMHEAAYPPTPPSDISASPQDHAVQVSWQPPHDDGGSGVTGYTVDVEPGGHHLTIGAATRNATVSGLANGTPSTVIVTAQNAIGTSPVSDAATVVPIPGHSVPSAPPEVLLQPDVDRILVDWPEPEVPGSSPVTSYTVRLSTGAVQTVPAPGTNAAIPVPAGQPISATVTASNADGTSAPTASAAPATASHALAGITNLRVIEHHRTVTVVWDNPSSVAGHPITGSCAEAEPWQWGRCAPGGGSAVSLPIRHSENKVLVAAGNDLQAAPSVESAYFGAEPVDPTPVPDRPATATAAASPTSVTVSWMPPAGGTPVRDYVVSLRPDGRSLVADATAHSVTFTGVMTGGSYNALVQADGDGGLGEATPTATVTVLAPPTPPSSAVTISGAASRTTSYGTTVTVAGTAAPGCSVGLWFRQAGASSYVQRRTLSASSGGAWSTTYVANDDYRLYATCRTAQSTQVLVQVAPTTNGAATRTVKKKSTVTLTGTGLPGKTLTLHFHRAGTAATDYSILRTVTVGSNGIWSRPYVADVDYRVYATLPNATSSPTVLIQAR
jgi:hypothetical protein